MRKLHLICLFFLLAWSSSAFSNTKAICNELGKMSNIMEQLRTGCKYSVTRKLGKARDLISLWESGIDGESFKREHG